MTKLDPTHAIFPGSFDPPTLGHVDLIERALGLFETVTLAVGAHPNKKGLLSADARCALLHQVSGQLAGSERLRIVQLDALLVDGCREHGAGTVVRGLRSGADFEYEAQMAATNRAMEPGIDTVYLGAMPAVAHLSSTLVRQIAAMGGDISSLVPKAVLDALAKL
jgi:pantetheine-phosphate adenylyltransferase